MKKLLILMAASALLLASCTLLNTKHTAFEEIEKIDIEVKDYVEETQSPTPDQTLAPSPEATTQVVKTPTPVNSTTPAVTEQPTNTPQNNTPAPTDKIEETTKPQEKGISGKVICIDAGHGKFSENKKEAISPTSSTKKDGHSVGTKGKTSTEDDVTLAIANKLKAKLEENGAKVIMTRVDENATMSNVERTQFANTNKADISIKLHADGTLEGGSGMTMLYPSKKNIKNTELVDNSKRLGQAILKNAISLTGANNRGIYANSQMAGFNWSEVPVVLFEMGFMTNPKDEKKLNDSEYQDKIVQGIVNGIIEYFK